LQSEQVGPFFVQVGEDEFIGALVERVDDITGKFFADGDRGQVGGER
jgi:hypothetical protein